MIVYDCFMYSDSHTVSKNFKGHGAKFGTRPQHGQLRQSASGWCWWRIEGRHGVSRNLVEGPRSDSTGASILLDPPGSRCCAFNFIISWFCHDMRHLRHVYVLFVQDCEIHSYFHTSNSGLIQRWIRHSRNEHLWISTLAATTQGSPFWQTWGANSYEPRRQQVGRYLSSIDHQPDIFLQIQWLNPKTYIVYEDPNLVESCWIHWLFWIQYLRHSPAKNLWVK